MPISTIVETMFASFVGVEISLPPGRPSGHFLHCFTTQVMTVAETTATEIQVSIFVHLLSIFGVHAYKEQPISVVFRIGLPENFIFF